jgi:hypothetical protein
VNISLKTLGGVSILLNIIPAETLPVSKAQSQVIFPSSSSRGRGEGNILKHSQIILCDKGLVPRAFTLFHLEREEEIVSKF